MLKMAGACSSCWSPTRPADLETGSRCSGIWTILLNLVRPLNGASRPWSWGVPADSGLLLTRSRMQIWPPLPRCRRIPPFVSAVRDVRDVRLSRCRRGLGREVAAFVPPDQINGRGVRCEKSTWQRVSSPLSSRGLGLFSSCLTGMGWSHRVLTWPGLYQERHRRSWDCLCHCQPIRFKLGPHASPRPSSSPEQEPRDRFSIA